MKKIITFLFGICLAPQLVAQEQQYFMNPVIRGDMPDPSMIRIYVLCHRNIIRVGSFLLGIHIQRHGQLETGGSYLL